MQVIALYKQAKDELKAANEQLEELRHGNGPANGLEPEVARLKESLRAKDAEVSDAQRRLEEERARVTSLQSQLTQAKSGSGSSELEKQAKLLKEEVGKLKQSLASKEVREGRHMVATVHMRLAYRIFCWKLATFLSTTIRAESVNCLTQQEVVSF